MLQFQLYAKREPFLDLMKMKFFPSIASRTQPSRKAKNTSTTTTNNAAQATNSCAPAMDLVTSQHAGSRQTQNAYFVQSHNAGFYQVQNGGFVQSYSAGYVQNHNAGFVQSLGLDTMNAQTDGALQYQNAAFVQSQNSGSSQYQFAGCLTHLSYAGQNISTSTINTHNAASHFIAVMGGYDCERNVGNLSIETCLTLPNLYSSVLGLVQAWLPDATSPFPLVPIVLFAEFAWPGSPERQGKRKLVYGKDDLVWEHDFISILQSTPMHIACAIKVSWEISQGTVDQAHLHQAGSADMSVYSSTNTAPVEPGHVIGDAADFRME